MLDILVDRAVGERHEVWIGDFCDLRNQVARLDNDDFETTRVQAEHGEIANLVERPAPGGQDDRHSADFNHGLPFTRIIGRQ